MEKIPITFEFEGTIYRGIFSKVSGGGSSCLFHLMIDNFYYGQMSYAESGWRFSSNKDFFKGMDEYFGGYVIAWVDCNYF